MIHWHDESLWRQRNANGTQTSRCHTIRDCLSSENPEILLKIVPVATLLAKLGKVWVAGRLVRGLLLLRLAKDTAT